MLLLEKELSARLRPDSRDYFNEAHEARAFEKALNNAIQQFVHLVVTDSQIAELLTSPP